MGSSYHTLLVTILIFLLGSIFSAISPALGGKTLDEDDWDPIRNLSNPVVQKVAKFAVTTQNSQHQAALVIDRLIEGQTKEDGGTNYRLTIAAKDGNDDDTLRNYEALVIDRQNTLELEYFKGPI